MRYSRETGIHTDRQRSLSYRVSFLPKGYGILKNELVESNCLEKVAQVTNKSPSNKTSDKQIQKYPTKLRTHTNHTQSKQPLLTTNPSIQNDFKQIAKTYTFSHLRESCVDSVRKMPALCYRNVICITNSSCFPIPPSPWGGSGFSRIFLGYFPVISR